MQTTVSKYKQGVCICFKTQDKILKCKEGFQKRDQGYSIQIMNHKFLKHKARYSNVKKDFKNTSRVILFNL